MSNAQQNDTFSLTLLTDLTSPDGFYISNPRVQTNTAVDFLEFMLQQCQAGHIAAGDTVILDNSRLDCNRTSSRTTVLVQHSLRCGHHRCSGVANGAVLFSSDLSADVLMRAEPMRACFRAGSWRFRLVFRDALVGEELHAQSPSIRSTRRRARVRV